MTYPYTIDNGHGERLTFLKRGHDGINEFVEVENMVSPGIGPPMHLHHLQDERLTVIEGKMGVQIEDQNTQYVEAGESIHFPKGQMHRFWNAGTTTKRCRGMVWPPHNVEYFLKSLYESTRTSKNGRPAIFDAAYLIHRYKTEFQMDVPAFVQKIVFPLVATIGRLLGKYKKFGDAPTPVKSFSSVS